MAPRQVCLASQRLPSQSAALDLAEQKPVCTALFDMLLFDMLYQLTQGQLDILFARND
jgi:hypothetical protein